jgi:hypothetical protein
MNVLVLWHGAHRWEGPPQLKPAGKMKSEEGSGLYLTTSEQTARKYAKGGGVVMRFEVDSNLNLLNDAWLSKDDVMEFICGTPGLRNRSLIGGDLLGAFERQRKRDPTNKVQQIPAYILENLMVNHGALKGKFGPLLAQWFVSRGIDANLIRRSDEDWLVLYNLDKIVSYRRARPEEVRDLPRVSTGRSSNPVRKLMR